MNTAFGHNCYIHKKEVDNKDLKENHGKYYTQVASPVAKNHPDQTTYTSGKFTPRPKTVLERSEKSKSNYRSSIRRPPNLKTVNNG